MTYISIVKGKIIETTGGNYDSYAQEDIITSSAKSIAETGVEKGVLYAKNPKKPLAGAITAKCIVEFRPHTNYKGEYGFDWLRAGDTGQQGDVWLGNIVGKHYDEANFLNVIKDGNTWTKDSKKNPKGFFKKDIKAYDRLLKSYKCLNISWKDHFEGKKRKKVPYLYPIPTLTILEGKTATFNLKIEIKEIPKKLTLEFKDPNANKYFETNILSIGDIKKGKYEKFNYLKITCIKSFSNEQLLYVKSDGEICGALKIHANSEANRKIINVVYVKVKTNINDVTVIGSPITGGLSFFKQCFNQALVIPKVKEETKTLDCTGNFFFKTFRDKFCSKKNSKYIFDKSNGLKEYLEQELKSQFNNKYNGFYTMFFIGDEYPSFNDKGVKVGHTNGFSYFGTKFGVYFDGHNSSTLAHETMHAMYLPHTFDGISQYSKFTYQAGQTDNLMDYSHWSIFGGKIRKSLFFWQWQTLNNKIK